MTREGAETAVVTSALVMTGMYLYRRLTEGIGEREKRKPTSSKSVAEGVIGKGELLPTGTWIIGMGVTFIGLSILTSAAPSAGGYGSVLIATTSFFANGEALFSDLKTSSNSALSKQEGKSTEQPTSQASAPATIQEMPKLQTVTT